MPNWCTTNYIAVGEPEELRAFCEVLNTMPNLENGFGRYWAGNFLGALDKEVENCRGTFDTDFYALPCFCGPDVNEGRGFEMDEDGVVRFSTTSAWGRMMHIEDVIGEKWPSIELSFSSTDEFGNFHYIRNLNNHKELTKYEVDGESFSVGEFGEFRNALSARCPGLNVPETEQEMLDCGFSNAFSAWKIRHKEEDLYYIIYEEV